jgi:hypothetical protein
VGAGQQEEEVVGGAAGLVDAALFEHAQGLELGRAAGEGVLAEAGAAHELAVAQAGKEAALVAGRDGSAADQVVEESLVLARAATEGGGGQAQGGQDFEGVATQGGQAAGADEAVEELDKDGGGLGALGAGCVVHGRSLLVRAQPGVWLVLAGFSIRASVLGV